MDTEKLVLSVMELLSFLPFMLPMCNMDMGHIHLLWAVTFFKTWLKIKASPEFEELFLAEMVHKVSQGTGEDILFCSGFQDSSGKSGNSFVHCSSALSGEISYVSMINILLCYIGLDQVLDVDIHADGFCVLHVPVFWSVLSPDRNGIDTSVDASLSLSFRSVLIFNNSFLLTSVNWQFQFHIPQLELESQQLDSRSSAVHCWPCPHSFNRVEYFC
ncbi:hypothetical protein CK203_043748 [Vitis vinifera]|uniref:Uncharacterized protein n=1 Tax=Vitis vinifera TaxID=29760 RepID=A0A438HW82_VITVI|nr:hypothetical protein CK203_043748 [Vitis vinifera]